MKKPHLPTPHPWTAILILAVDWLAFSVEFFSGFLATPLTVLVAGTIGFIGTYQIQKKKAGDDTGKAILKAVAGAIACGVPTPITGTIVGTYFLSQARQLLSSKDF